VRTAGAVRAARRAVGGAVAALVDLALPATCAACGTEGVALCPACRVPLDGPAHPVRPDPVPPGLPATALFMLPILSMVIVFQLWYLRREGLR
jgi:hypothetical protein